MEKKAEKSLKNQKTTTIPLQTIPYNSLTIGDFIGNGSYGDVYKATWHGTEVALKQLHLKTLPIHLKEEFDREAQIMAQCRFPHIVGLYGVCTDTGHCSLVMEYLPRGSLYSVLQNKSDHLDWDLRWDIAIDIGKGLSYLHDKKILHRDLKSQNILLDINYCAKIGDFGLSKIKLESSSTTTNNKTVGTTRWMAPELLSMNNPSSPTTASDVYSYGMVLWEISAREIPFTEAPNEMVATMWIANKKKETIPTSCPQTYGNIVQETWLEADQRPSAEEVVTHLTQAKQETTSKISKISSRTKQHYVEKSWHFDPAVERKARGNEHKPYQLLEASKKDKQKVISFYQHHPVPGYDIGSVQVIYNRDFNQAFELQIKKLQQKHDNPAFAPKWHQENDQKWRAATNQKLEDIAHPYFDKDYPNVKIVPLWHGTNRAILDGLFRTGYASLATTDSGFFGKGLYGAYEAEYSYRVYGPGAKGADGALILNWVVCSSAYPVIHGDMDKLIGRGNFENYDLHFVPVVPKNADDPNETEYFPCPPNQKNIYTEAVTFESASCLPRYLVELQSSKPQPNKLNSTSSLQNQQPLSTSNNPSSLFATKPSSNVKSSSLFRKKKSPSPTPETGNEKEVKHIKKSSQASDKKHHKDKKGKSDRHEEKQPHQSRTVKTDELQELKLKEQQLKEQEIKLKEQEMKLKEQQLKEQEIKLKEQELKLKEQQLRDAEERLKVMTPLSQPISSNPSTFFQPKKPLPPEYECKATWQGHDGWVDCVAVLPNGQVISGSHDNTLKVWDGATGNCVATWQGHSRGVQCVAVLPNGRVISGSSDYTLKVWDSTTGKCVATCQGHGGSVSCVAVLPNGQVISGSFDATLKVWDSATGKCVATWQGHSRSVKCVAVLPNGQVISGSWDKTLKAWDSATGQCVATWRGHILDVNCVAVLPNGQVISGSYDGTLKVWDSATGKCVVTWPTGQEPVQCVAVLPNGLIISGDTDKTLKVWDSATRKRVATWQGHSDWVYCVAVLPNGQVISGSRDQTLKVWVDKNALVLEEKKDVSFNAFSR